MTFPTEEGFLTQIIQKEYIKYLLEKGEINDNHINKNILSLNATDNNTPTLYFWQLYSILGKKPIEKLITNFYTRVFNDNEKPWFRDFFIELGSLEYHIKGQTNFWLDVMGAGEYYRGGEKRLNFKHDLAREIMTNKAANRWMYHMLLALDDNYNNFKIDKRILPCLKKFLLFFMNKYSLEFDFNFIEVKSKLLQLLELINLISSLVNFLPCSVALFNQKSNILAPSGFRTFRVITPINPEYKNACKDIKLLISFDSCFFAKPKSIQITSSDVAVSNIKLRGLGSFCRTPHLSSSKADLSKLNC